MGVGPEAFRAVLRRYPTGVTVVTMRAGEREHGMTANAVTPVSLEPPLYLVCLAKTVPAHDLLPEAGGFLVNILGEDQENVSRTFSDDDLGDDGRWATVQTTRSDLGPLRIEGCIGYLGCSLTDALPGGDHTIYVGEIVSVEPGLDREPLVFHGGGYRRLAPVDG